MPNRISNIGKLLNLLGTTLACFAVATLLMQLVLGGVFWASGHFTEEKRYGALAAI